MKRILFSILLASGCAPAPRVEPEPPRIADRLAAPVTVLVREGDRNHYRVSLYPAFGDFDNNGRGALLVGPSEAYGNEGRLQIFRDLSPGTEVRLGPPRWFDDLVPTGRIKPG